MSGWKRANATTLLTVVVVLFAMREAQAIVVPILMAFFLAVVGFSLVLWLEKWRLPRIAAILLVVAGIAAALFALGLLVGTSFQDLSARAPEYQQRLREQIDSRLAGTRIGADAAGIVQRVAPDSALTLASSLLTGVRDLFSSAFLIFFLMIFMLLEAELIDAKLVALGIPPPSLRSAERAVRRYLAIKTLTSLATGVLVGLMLSALGADFAVLWGLLAFLLNYVPSIGSILAAVPAVLLTLVSSGPSPALLVAAGYLLINMTIGNVIEPRIMGQGLGLSTLVVFLSLILWGWLLGPVGMLLSVPLTTMIKIVLESRRSTRPMALLLGSEVPQPTDKDLDEPSSTRRRSI